MDATFSPKRIQILGIHPEDAYYPKRDKIIGHTGMFYSAKFDKSTQRESPQLRREYYAGEIFWDRPYPGQERNSFFLAVKYKNL